MSEEVRYLDGGIAIDDRGVVQFCNDFDMREVRRFYIVANHAKGFVRAWHAHKKEAKFVSVVSGAAIVAAVKITDWEHPDQHEKVMRFVMSGSKTAVLAIPAGYANGFKTLTDDAKLIFYSTATLEESAGDDYRYDARYWDPWSVEER